MKRLLLDRIHGFYLAAISRVPAALLRSRLHRALLMAGHCYGPFDPVANILANAIWHDAAFPVRGELFEADMIRRSLDGLVAFVRALFPGLSKHDAVRHLLRSNASQPRRGHQERRGARPHTRLQIAAELTPAVAATLKPLLQAKRALSPDDVVLLENHPRSEPVKLVDELTPRASQMVSERKNTNLRLIRNGFAKGLKLHCRNMHGYRQGDEYEIHAICGVNTEICEDGRFGYFLNLNGYPFSHVNAWARRRGSHHADDTAPVLLFIEVQQWR
ncbi:hypothetical protein ACP70R_024207 [Stipagrostis hirtigluma subsp. patula]